MKLNNLSSKPLYSQLKEFLIEDIMNGVYKPNELLPSETELCEKYSVSRITTRRALSELAEDGFLTRRQGKGTYVTNRRIKKELISFNSYSQFIGNLGEIPKNIILSKKVIQPNYVSNEIIDGLRVNENTSILELKRLHFLSEEPFILETSYYSLSRFPGLVEYIEGDLSTYNIFRTKYDTFPYYSHKMLSGKLANNDTIKNLKLVNGETIFELKEIVYCSEKTPLHYSISLLPTSKVTFTLNTSLEDNK